MEKKVNPFNIVVKIKENNKYKIQIDKEVINHNIVTYLDLNEPLKKHTEEIEKLSA